jgi:hypothetical protein
VVWYRIGFLVAMMLCMDGTVDTVDSWEDPENIVFEFDDEDEVVDD